MQTGCRKPKLVCQALGRRAVVAQFNGGAITSDAGASLLRDADGRLNLLDRFAACFTDHRNPNAVEFSVRESVAQRVIAIALGYEDLKDHDKLRHDPALAVVAGRNDPRGGECVRRRDRGKALAGKSTLNRLELSVPEEAASDRYKRISVAAEAVDRLFVELFLEAHQSAPEWITLDLDATDDPVHGKQEGRFFHGYYRHYCYPPLYIFCGEHLLAARLRSGEHRCGGGGGGGG